MDTISIVIPVFNESKIIYELIKRVRNTVDKLNLNYEILLIDDGSYDETWNQIKKVKSENVNVKGIKFSRNFGHHYAITAGIHNANGDYVVVMDGDLQDQPEAIEELYKKIKEGYDAVFVSRQNRKDNKAYLFLQRTFYFFLNSLSGIKFDSRQANFSIINKKVIESFKNFNESSRFYVSTIKWLGFNMASINADHGNRFAGRPSYTIKKRFKLAFEIIVAFSDRPLKIAISIGIFMSILSGVIATWILYSAIFNGYQVLGWASLITATFFIGGLVLIVLGIMGIYIGQIFREVKKRPLYIISEKI